MTHAGLSDPVSREHFESLENHPRLFGENFLIVFMLARQYMHCTPSLATSSMPDLCTNYPQLSKLKIALRERLHVDQSIVRAFKSVAK